MVISRLKILFWFDFIRGKMCGFVFECKSLQLTLLANTSPGTLHRLCATFPWNSISCGIVKNMLSSDDENGYQNSEVVKRKIRQTPVTELITQKAEHKFTFSDVMGMLGSTGPEGRGDFSGISWDSQAPCDVLSFTTSHHTRRLICE